MVVPIERNRRRFKVFMVNFPKELDSLTVIKLIRSIFVRVQVFVLLSVFSVSAWGDSVHSLRGLYLRKRHQPPDTIAATISDSLDIRMTLSE